VSVEVNYKIAGLDQLQKALTDLPKELVSNKGGPVKTALMAAALPVLRTAQITVPDRDSTPNSGTLAKMIKRRRATKSGPGWESVQVYVRGNKQQEKDAYYAAWVEFGHQGYDASRWFSQSLESNVPTSLGIFRKNLATSIEKIAKKIGNENARKVAAEVKSL